MPFLPLFIAQLGVTDVGSIAIWTGVSLGVTPADRRSGAGVGPARRPLRRWIMVQRSMISFVV
jgi:hypothetical protein